jgi:uncharacterized SAM-binding protein YcdF (DUF218 family)
MTHTKKIVFKVSFAIIFLFLLIILANLGNFLVVKDNPSKSDVIIIFSGDNGARTIQGLKLYNEHYAPKIIMSGGTVYQDLTMAKIMKEHAISLGVATDDIITEEEANSTYENIAFSKRIMEQHNYKSAIIVSSDYHMKRIKLTCEKIFNNTEIRLTYSSCKDNNFNSQKWWTSNKSIMTVINEYFKIAGYLVGKYN